jgi:hypothetical protein
MMKKPCACLLPALALLLLFPFAGRADPFSQIENSPYTYWVPAPTPPPPGYMAGPPQGYYGGPPPPGYYGPPPSPSPVVVIPRFFIGFHFH